MKLGSVSLAMMVLLVVGCGDDGDPGTPDAGSLAVAQCVNTNDIAIAEEVLGLSGDGGVPDGGVPDGGAAYQGYLTAILGNLAACSQGPCLGDIISQQDPTDCYRTCLDGEPEADLSAECLDCYTELVRCGARECAVPCLGSDQEACLTCNATNCTPRLVECAGFN